MELEAAIDRFAVRLYEWSAKDFQREVFEDFPLLSLAGLNNRGVAAFVQWVKEMPSSDQTVLVRDLPRLSHARAMALLGRPLSPSERKVLNEQFALELNLREHYLPPLTTADKRLPTFKPIDPNRCMSLIYDWLPVFLGKPSRQKMRVRAVKWIGDWKLITEFYFYKPDKFLFCEYQFIRRDGKPIFGHFSEYPRNPFMFYGVYSTYVYVPSEADCEPMAKAMVRIGSHFVSQAEPLFVGLGIGD
jgi:hypothetical protein